MGPKRLLGREIWDPFAYYGWMPKRDKHWRESRGGAGLDGTLGNLFEGYLLTGRPSPLQRSHYR